MNLKSRLQRMLQIVEDAERNGALADIERDILLNELREAYAMLRFVDDYEPQHAVATPVVEPSDADDYAEEPIEEELIDEPAFEPTEEEEDEPEVEVELIFNEDDDEEEEQEEQEEVVVEFEPEETPAVVEEPIAEPMSEPIVAEPIVAEPIAEPVVADEPSTAELPTAPATTVTPKRSSILSLYDEDPAPVVGEQFRETPSVADVISAQKGVSVAPSVTSLRSAIGVADKFMFIRELFNDDVEAYESAIDSLEAQPSLDDCVIYISENYAWNPNGEGTKLMMQLLERKYN